MEGRNGQVIIIGGGASGILAAISARRSGAQVVICERMMRLGKKILASGNGRCNLSNEKLDSSSYNPSARGLVDSVFSQFGRDNIRNFFEDLGLRLRSEEGRTFPATNQSQSVLKVLDMELKRLSIPVEYGFKVSGITGANGKFIVLSDSGKKVTGRSVVIACGGKSYPALGSDGSAYDIAKRFGHTIVEPVPAAVSVIVKDALCHILQGQRISARVVCVIDGKSFGESSGDLLFTKYGLSGTAILDSSRDVSIAINRGKRHGVVLSVDLIPFMEDAELACEIARRIDNDVSAEDLLAGILPNKFGSALKDLLTLRDPDAIAKALKHRLFKVTGTRGWNEADFTAGGVNICEVSIKTLESVLREGIYFAGEVLDVDGKRGGYNLAWAWASGYVAGKEASR